MEDIFKNFEANGKFIKFDLESPIGHFKCHLFPFGDDLVIETTTMFGKGAMKIPKEKIKPVIEILQKWI